MTTDKAPADSVAFGYAGGGDAGRGRVEHRSFRHVEVTQSVRNSLSRGTCLFGCSTTSTRILIADQVLLYCS